MGECVGGECVECLRGLTPPLSLARLDCVGGNMWDGWHHPGPPVFLLVLLTHLPAGDPAAGSPTAPLSMARSRGIGAVLSQREPDVINLHFPLVT